MGAFEYASVPLAPYGTKIILVTKWQEAEMKRLNLGNWLDYQAHLKEQRKARKAGA